MSEQTEPQTGEGKISSIWGAIKDLMTEDPLLGALFVALILPFSIALWNAVNQKDIEIMILALSAIAAIVLLVFIPLLIVKAVF